MLKTGIDLVHLEKIKKVVNNEAAMKRLFHPSEALGSLEHLAGIIAVKEAFFKALGTLPQWLDIEVCYEPSGKPQLKYTSTLQKRIKEVDVSISHDNDYAIASVVLQLNENNE